MSKDIYGSLGKSYGTKKSINFDEEKKKETMTPCVKCQSLIRKNVYNIEGRDYCNRCFLPLYEKAYDTSPTDITARFLIKQGRKSEYWKRSTQAQKDYTMKYYEANKQKVKEMLNGLNVQPKGE